MTEAEIFYQLFRVIGVITVATIVLLILSGIGGLIWIFYLFFWKGKQKPRSRPICLLTWEECIYIDDNMASCRDCQAYKDFTGKGSEDESDRQDGPQR